MGTGTETEGPGNRDAAEARSSVAPLRLLLVEDDRLSAKHARHLMEMAGHTVRHAADGGAALGLLTTERFDAVFLDIELPDTDGFALAHSFRAIPETATPHSVPLFALTGRDLGSANAQARTAGFTGILSKPLSRSGLASALAAPHQPPPRDTTKDASLAAEFARIFLEELPRRYDELRHAAAEGDMRGVKRVAHSLKSSTAMVGADSASAIARELEQAAAGDHHDECLELLVHLENELNSVQERLAALTSNAENL